MAKAIWLRESDEAVWHRLTVRSGKARWRTACGWEMALRGQVWPQKGDDAGPQAAERCNDCVAGVTTPAEESRDEDDLR
jgi:hypothetical protein